MVAGTVVVTGAASGIGRRAAVHLARRGHHVVAVTRSDARAAGVVAEARAAAGRGGRITSVPADLADLGAVRAAAGRIAALGPVHAVVNNAAILAVARRRPSRTADGIEEVLAVNHVAPVVLTTALLPALVSNGRVIGAGSQGLAVVPWLRLDVDDLDSARRWSPVRAYYRSKLAQLAFVAELGARGVAAAAVRIPSVRLDAASLARYPALLRWLYVPKQRVAADPDDVALAGYVALVDRDVPARGHVALDGTPLPWPSAIRDPDVRRRVWERTIALADAAR